MDAQIIEQLKKTISGDVMSDKETLATYSHDASIFSITPQLVIFPKDATDVASLVSFVSAHKKSHPDLSLTARAASTCMSGGGLSSSLVVSFLKYFNRTPVITKDIAETQPGVYYRDFEKETLKYNLIFPSYPSSREICAMGGIINNNSGGEKSLQYGKTERYIKELTVILADGNEYVLKSLTTKELQAKIKQKNFEGDVYRKMYALINDNYDLIQKARPDVSKNSAGYYLWNVYDKKRGIFDLTKLFVGAQGTLGFVVDAKLQLVPVKQYSQMLVINLYDLRRLGEIVNTILPFEPESFETYDDNTLKLATKYFSSFGKKLGTKNILETFLAFFPEMQMKFWHKLPLLVLQVEFTGDNNDELAKKIADLQIALKKFHVNMHVAASQEAAKKYWLIRRESFNLLRQRIANVYSAPFIDDFVIKPEYLPEFLPKLRTIFSKYPQLIYTIAGHIGNGNFHIIPLMDIRQKEIQEIIPKLSHEVFDLVLSYHGSTSGEHNDGLIRTPFVEQMYGQKLYALFQTTKTIFDPLTIFNPGKKVNGNLDEAMKHIRQAW